MGYPDDDDDAVAAALVTVPIGSAELFSRGPDCLSIKLSFETPIRSIVLMGESSSPFSSIGRRSNVTTKYTSSEDLFLRTYLCTKRPISM